MGKQRIWDLGILWDFGIFWDFLGFEIPKNPLFPPCLNYMKFKKKNVFLIQTKLKPNDIDHNEYC
jgi:hypothetical protein